MALGKRIGPPPPADGAAPERRGRGRPQASGACAGRPGLGGQDRAPASRSSTRRARLAGRGAIDSAEPPSTTSSTADPAASARRTTRACSPCTRPPRHRNPDHPHPPRLARVRGRVPGRFPRPRLGPSTSRPAPGPRPGPSGTAGEVLELHRRQRQVTPDRRPREPHRVRPCPQDVAAAGEDGPPPLQPAARRPTADLGQDRLTDPIGHVHDLPVHPRHHRDGRSALVLDHSNRNGPPIGTGGTGRGGRTSADVGRLRPEADASQSLPA
jgi:hypothetical protein